MPSPPSQTEAGVERRDLAELEAGELEAALEPLGIERYHARQIYRWIHRRGVAEFAKMTDLSRDLRARLDRSFTIGTPRTVVRDRSADGTEKFLLELADGRRIEAVFIPDTPASAGGARGARMREARARGARREPTRSAGWREASAPGRGASGAYKEGAPRAERMTVCISTQVGCAMRCGFCLTGKMGLARNLTAGEIAGQVRALATALNLLEARFNIVLMGMGEPLHNYDQTMKALRMLADPEGLAVSPRRVTLSTVGVLPGLERLAAEPLMPNLAISLHATTEDVRDQLVPVNRKYGLADIIEACKRFPLKRRNRITFEYVLLRGVNDAPEDARRLVGLLSGVRCKVNLIPLNEAAGIPFDRPTDDRVDRFARVLAEHHLTVSVRKSRGRDIRAACGQLIVEGQQRSPAQKMAAAMDGS